MSKPRSLFALLTSIVLAAGTLIVSAAIPIPTGTPYQQDFNAIGASSTATLPADFRVDRTATSTAADVRKVGTWAAAGTQTTQTGGTNLSTSASNGIYNFGATANTLDRAIGFLSSGTATASGNLYAQLSNDTGAALSSLQIAYTVEKYRNGINVNGFRIQLFYSLDGTSWTSAGSTFTTAFAADSGTNSGFASAPGVTVPVSGTLDVAVPAGGLVYLAWNYSVTSGNTVTNAQALAVDDISILGVGSTSSASPSGTGSATPSTVGAGAATLLSATITPGTIPPSTGLAVSCDLSPIGGSAAFPLPPAGGSIYSASYTVPTGSVPQAHSLACTVTDEQMRQGNFPIALTVTAPFECGAPATPIHQIQGGGLSSALTGQTHEIEGIVVADYQLSSQLRGFYLQEPDASWDADATTSEGIFVFDNAAGLDVHVGDRVRVKGAVSEFSGSGSFLGANRTSTLTELGAVSNKLVCSSGVPVTRTTVTLPTATATDLERYEGMAVRIDQRLVVTGNFSLGTFGQLDLAPSVLFTPTHSPDRTTWADQANLLPRSVIALDDASSLSNVNLFPTIFPPGGLSATNTLRVGAIVNYDAATGTNTPLIGVLDDRFGAYRIQPTEPVTFHAANPRLPATPIVAGVGGRFRAVSANVLNFFTTFGSRGAANATEFEHQKTKIVEELVALNGDVVGLSEVQNFVTGGTNGGVYTNSALQSLIDGLNCRFAGDVPTCATPPPTPFAFVDSLPLGVSNGTDAIRNAIVYRADRLQPVGGPALYNQNDTNRPSLAQTFRPASGAKAAQQTFTFVANHFKSKGSACGAGLDDPLQGNCNGLRLDMAQGLVTWLSGNPTFDTAATRRLLLVGDFNAYYGEDPIQFLASAGYSNLIAALLGPGAYSYNFGSQRGYLDHALTNASMNLLVKAVAEWHNNSDEPSSLQALSTSTQSAAAQAAYYGPDPFAASDHDPIVIGFNTLAGDLNDDGVVNTVDQQLVTRSIGRSASDVDRRMDFDGDGTITLNDYRIWTGYYRAFVQ